MTLHVLIPCSKSKSIDASDDLTWSAKMTRDAWLAAWTSSMVKTPADLLYTGRIFVEQMRLCSEHEDVKVYIISAGAGLIHPPGQAIPSYEATFQNSASIAHQHWTNLPLGGLEKLILNSGDQVLCFAPPAYQRALKGDPRYHEVCPALIVLSSSPLAGEATTVLNVHPRAKEVLKVSSRDLNTHLLRLYLSGGEGAIDSLYRDCLVLPVAKMRRSIGDEELRELISKAPPEIRKSISRTVRYIRRECHVSSIDTRIRKILLEVRGDS